MDNPAVEIWASLAMFKLKSLNLKFSPFLKPAYVVNLLLCEKALQDKHNIVSKVFTY